MKRLAALAFVGASLSITCSKPGNRDLLERPRAFVQC